MEFYNAKENVDWYEGMVKDYDASVMLSRFSAHVAAGARVLELGLGPGLDHDVLRTSYRMVGVDISDEFVRRYRARHKPGDIDVRVADAVTLAPFDDAQFDAVFSNKVLHHLTEDDLVLSLRRQARLLRPGGVLFHTLWLGDKEEFIHGMRFRYYTPQRFEALLPTPLELRSIDMYKEIDADDSFVAVVQKPA